MTSRGGNQYDRTIPEAFLRPGLGIRNWGTRSNYPGPGIVPTGPNEISFYVTHHFELSSDHIGRFTLRTDGDARVYISRTGSAQFIPRRDLNQDASISNFHLIGGAFV